MLNKIIFGKSWKLLIIFVILDIFCVGLGMGIPFFCILFGFPVGWIINLKMKSKRFTIGQQIRKTIIWSAVSSGFTFILMLIVWGFSTRTLITGEVDLANFGIPMILFEPLASFIAWMVLMIFISPFLQFLMSIFGANLGLIWTQRHLDQLRDAS